MPKVAALLVTMIVALVALLGLAWLVSWAFGRVGTSIVGNAAMLQALFTQKMAWLDARGIEAAGALAGQFDARWLVRVAQGVLSGKYLPDAAPPPDSRAARNDRRILQTEFRPESLQLAQRFTAHAARKGLTPTALALGWVWNNRLVHGLIGGPRTLAQWQDYLDALQQPFDTEDEGFVSSLVAAGHASTPGYTDAQYPVTGRVPRNC